MERLPGFRDFYPEPLPPSEPWSADVRRHVFDAWQRVARRYGFREYDGPPLESLELFTLKSGQEIVGQLYNFTDKGERAVALRPEMTPTLARMIAARERAYRKPIKWFAIPQLYRYERQQKGRLREHFQYNADIFGEASPAADAELIALLIDSLRALGLTAQDFVVRVSSRNAWSEFFRRRHPGGEREYDFFQLVDKLEREDPAVSDPRLRELGFSLDEVRGFIAAAEPTTELRRILEDLEARGLAQFVRIDYNVIRGLAYYTGPVFEAFDCQGEFRAIAGGGRYDQLVKLVSGGKVDLPGLGFGMGDVVLTELLRSRALLPRFGERLDAYVLIEDEALRPESLRLIQELRNAGRIVDYPLVSARGDKQLKRALEQNATFALCLQREPGFDLRVRLRDLRSRAERTVARSEVLGAVQVV